MDSEEALRRGSAFQIFDDGHAQNLCALVDGGPKCCLVQPKMKMEVKALSETVSTTSIDRLLNGHAYTRRKLVVQPAENSRL